MELALAREDLWDIVEGTDIIPEEGKSEEIAKATTLWKKNNKKALAIMCQGINDSELTNIRKCKSAAEAWKALDKIYETKGLARKLYLRKRFYNFEMVETDSMQQNINILTDLADQLAGVGIEVTDEDMAMQLLNSLPESYDTLITMLESRDKLEADFVKARLLQEEARQNEGSTSKENAAFLSKRKNQSSKSTNKYDKKNDKSIKCYHCGKPGHKKPECRKLKAELEGKNHANVDDKEESDSGKSALISIRKDNDYVVDQSQNNLDQPHKNRRCHIEYYNSIFLAYQEELPLCLDTLELDADVGSGFDADVRHTLRSYSLSGSRSGPSGHMDVTGLDFSADVDNYCRSLGPSDHRCGPSGQLDLELDIGQDMDTGLRTGLTSMGSKAQMLARGKAGTISCSDETASINSSDSTSGRMVGNNTTPTTTYARHSNGNVKLSSEWSNERENKNFTQKPDYPVRTNNAELSSQQADEQNSNTLYVKPTNVPYVTDTPNVTSASDVSVSNMLFSNWSNAHSIELSNASVLNASNRATNTVRSVNEIMYLYTLTAIIIVLNFISTASSMIATAWSFNPTTVDVAITKGVRPDSNAPSASVSNTLVKADSTTHSTSVLNASAPNVLNANDQNALLGLYSVAGNNDALKSSATRHSVLASVNAPSHKKNRSDKSPNDEAIASLHVSNVKNVSNVQHKPYSKPWSTRPLSHMALRLSISARIDTLPHKNKSDNPPNVAIAPLRAPSNVATIAPLRGDPSDKNNTVTAPLKRAKLTDSVRNVLNRLREFLSRPKAPTILNGSATGVPTMSITDHSSASTYEAKFEDRANGLNMEMVSNSSSTTSTKDMASRSKTTIDTQIFLSEPTTVSSGSITLDAPKHKLLTQIANAAFIRKAAHSSNSGECDHWFVDSGATQHMSSKRDHFQTYKDTTPSLVHMADGRTILAKGVGMMDLKLKVGQEIQDGHLQGVLYVPDLRGNLFSVDKTVELGNKVMFDKSGCVIKDNYGKTIATASKRQSLYQLDTIHIPTQANLASQADNADLWHRRLGHLSIDGMKKLKDGMVKDLNLNSNAPLNFCEACIQGKQHRTPFPSGTST